MNRQYITSQSTCRYSLPKSDPVMQLTQSTGILNSVIFILFYFFIFSLILKEIIYVHEKNGTVQMIDGIHVTLKSTLAALATLKNTVGQSQTLHREVRNKVNGYQNMSKSIPS